MLPDANALLSPSEADEEKQWETVRYVSYTHLTDLDRLAKIVNNPDYPVQFLFTGKAHPHDGAGQGLIKRIIEKRRFYSL